MAQCFKRARPSVHTHTSYENVPLPVRPVGSPKKSLGASCGRPPQATAFSLNTSLGFAQMEPMAATRCSNVVRASPSTTSAEPAASDATDTALICTSVTAGTTQAFLDEIKEATATGVDLIELRLDFIKDFDPSKDLASLMKACTIPYIVTYRPKWEGGMYEGSEPERLAALKFAALQGAPYVDVEYKAAHVFFAGRQECSSVWCISALRLFQCRNNKWRRRRRSPLLYLDCVCSAGCRHNSWIALLITSMMIAVLHSSVRKARSLANDVVFCSAAALSQH